MAITTPTLWNGMYMGDMSEQQANLVLETMKYDVIPNLKKVLYDFPPLLVKQSLEECLSIREIIKREGKDIRDYISDLRDYQTIGTAFMYLSPRSIIADGCGLGKTAEIAGLINWLKIKNEMTRFLLAVETSALGQHQCELMRFTGLNIVALPSEAPKLRRMIKNTDWNRVDGIIIKHSTLRSDPFSQWLSLNLDENGMCKLFNVFFLDESSVVKNDTTKTYNYTKNICSIVSRVHFMNATTFETNILDIYNQIDILNEKLLPKKWRIEKEFCTYGKSSYWTRENGKAKLNWRRERTGYKNQAKFKESLKLVYFGRSVKDIGKDIPHIYKVYEVIPTNDMSVALTKGYRYNELLNCPSLIPELDIPMTRKTVPKLDRLCTLIENEFSESQVMIYCFHLDAQAVIADELKKIGRKPVILNGSCDDIERLEAQNGFNSGKFDVIVTNIKKSLNLYGGDVCIFYSMETNIAKMEQIRGRIDRHVDDKIKTFVMLLYAKTDEYRFFSEVVCKRAKDSRDLTIDTETAADLFKKVMQDDD